MSTYGIATYIASKPRYFGGYLVIDILNIQPIFKQLVFHGFPLLF